MSELTAADIETASMDLREVIAALNQELGPTVVAVIGRVAQRSLPQRWEDGTSPLPTGQSERNLRTALKVFRMMALYDSPEAARAWMYAAHKNLNRLTPFAVIAKGSTDEVETVAHKDTGNLFRN